MTDNEVNRLQDKILEDIGRRLTQERDDRKEDYREITKRLDKIETKLEETLNYCHDNGGMLTGKLSQLLILKQLQKRLLPKNIFRTIL